MLLKPLIVSFLHVVFLMPFQYTFIYYVRLDVFQYYYEFGFYRISRVLFSFS